MQNTQLFHVVAAHHSGYWIECKGQYDNYVMFRVKMKTMQYLGSNLDMF